MTIRVWALAGVEARDMLPEVRQYLDVSRMSAPSVLDAHVILVLGASLVESPVVLSLLDRGVPLLVAGQHAIEPTLLPGVLYERTVADAFERLEEWDEMLARPWRVSDRWLRASIWSLAEEIQTCSEWMIEMGADKSTAPDAEALGGLAEAHQRHAKVATATEEAAQ